MYEIFLDTIGLYFDIFGEVGQIISSGRFGVENGVFTISTTITAADNISALSTHTVTALLLLLLPLLLVCDVNLISSIL